MSEQRNSHKGLKRVTFTGADDKTPIDELINIAVEFPFVEFGILVSASREGEPRYPSRDWQRRFRDAALDADIEVAMHVCGLYSREFFHAEYSPWERIGPVKHCARRMQINGGPRHCSMRLNQWLREILRRERIREFIFQVPNGQDGLRDCFDHNLSAFALFDESGGHGQVPRERRAPVGGLTIACAGKRFVGYAGGIGLNNLHAECDALGVLYQAINNLSRGPAKAEKRMMEIFKPFVAAHRDLIAWTAIVVFVWFYVVFSVWLLGSFSKDFMQARMKYLDWREKRREKSEC